MYSQYTGNTGSISTEELHTVASKAGTTKLALPQRKLATGELLPRRRRSAANVCRRLRRNSLQQQPCSGSAARNSVLFRPFVFVPASVRTYVSMYKRASERPRGERRRDEEVSRSGSILYILLGQFLGFIL